jgi:hypothetical protein
MTQVTLPNLGPLGGSSFRSLFDANRSGDAPAGLGAVLGAGSGFGLPADPTRLLRNTESLFDDKRRRDAGDVATAPGNGARGIGSLFDVADLIDKVGDALGSLVNKLFGDLNFGNVLDSLQDQVRNVLSAPFDGRAGGNLAVAGSTFASFQGVQISFETDGSHTQLHIKQTSVEAAYGFGATADGSLAYRLGSFSSETNELTIDLYAKGDETAVSALFQHTSLDVVAVQAVRQGPVALPRVGDSLPDRAADPAQANRVGLLERLARLFGPVAEREGKGADRPSPGLSDKPRALLVIDADKSRLLPVIEGSRLKLSLDMVLPIDLVLDDVSQDVTRKTAEQAAKSSDVKLSLDA